MVAIAGSWYVGELAVCAEDEEALDSSDGERGLALKVVVLSIWARRAGAS